jgi:hypothetical protein
MKTLLMLLLPATFFLVIACERTVNENYENRIELPEEPEQEIKKIIVQETYDSCYVKLNGDGDIFTEETKEKGLVKTIVFSNSIIPVLRKIDGNLYEIQVYDKKSSTSPQKYYLETWSVSKLSDNKKYKPISFEEFEKINEKAFETSLKRSLIFYQKKKKEVLITIEGNEMKIDWLKEQLSLSNSEYATEKFKNQIIECQNKIENLRRDFDISEPTEYQKMKKGKIILGN